MHKLMQVFLNQSVAIILIYSSRNVFDCTENINTFNGGKANLPISSAWQSSAAYLFFLVGYYKDLKTRHGLKDVYLLFN